MAAGLLAERKRAEEALRKREAHFHAVVENSHDGIIMLNADRRVMYVSPSYERINGFSPEEWMGVYGPDYIHPDDRAMTASVFRDLVKEPGAVASVEYRLRHKMGHWFWVETTAVNLLNVRHVQAVVLNSHDITERKRAEKALRESETRFRALSENALAGVYIIQDGHLTYVNKSFAALFGYVPDELIGADPLVVIHPDDRALARENIRRRMTGEIRTVQYECQGRRKNGETNHIEIFGARIDLDERPALVGTVIDITERKRAETVLQESEQTARRMAQQSQMVNQIGIKIAAGLDFEPLMQTLYEQCQTIGDADTFYIALYDEATGLLSFPVNYKDGERRVFPPRAIRDNAGLAGHIIEHRQTLYIPDSFSLPPGLSLVRQPGIPTRSFIGVPLFLNDRIVGVISMQSHAPHAYTPDQISTLEMLATQVAIAIQNSRLYEQVQRERNLADALVDNMPGAFCLVNPQGKLARWNKHAEAMWGYAPEEIKELDFQRLVAVEEQARIADMMAQVFETGQATVETQLLTKRGERIPLYLSGTRVQIGNQEYVLGIGLDITERKRAEEELSQSREQLRNLAEYLQSAREQERTSIAREIHDEFGQSLTALKMDLAWLFKRLPHEQPDLWAKVDSMSALVDGSIHTVRRIATELRPGVLDDLGLVAAIEWQTEEFAGRTGLTCTLRLGDHDLALEPDLATALFRILQESLTNIARHAEAAHVEVELDDQPGLLTLVVRDDGKGFEPAQRSDPSSLGLIGMRERARAWGGDVAVEGTAGQGTTVTVRIPQPSARTHTLEVLR